jgi:hypothetical protein
VEGGRVQGSGVRSENWKPRFYRASGVDVRWWGSGEKTRRHGDGETRRSAKKHHSRVAAGVERAGRREKWGERECRNPHPTLPRMERQKARGNRIAETIAPFPRPSPQGRGRECRTLTLPLARRSFKTAQEWGQAQFAPRTAHDHRGDGTRPVPGGFETASTTFIRRGTFVLGTASRRRAGCRSGRGSRRGAGRACLR